MSLLRDRLYTKVLMSFMWISLFIAFIGLVAYIQIKDTDQAMKAMTEGALPNSVIVKILNSKILNLQNQSLRLLVDLHNDHADKADSHSHLSHQLSSETSSILGTLDELERVNAKAEEFEIKEAQGKQKNAVRNKPEPLSDTRISSRHVINDLRTNLELYLVQINTFLEHYSTEPTKSETLFREQMDATFNQISAQLAQIDTLSSARIMSTSKAIKNDLNNILYILAGATCIGILLSVLIGQFFARRVSSPLVTLRNYIREIEQSDYQHKVPVQNSWYLELDQVRESFNLMITSLNKYLENLKEQRQKAEEANVAKSEFLASMSHEIRTPMNGVIGMLNLLKESSINDEDLKKVDMARSSAHSLLSLINDILDFSKIEAGKLDFEHLNLDLNDMLIDLAQSMSVLTKGKSLTIDLDNGELKQHHVKGDPGRIRQILTNLVSNAIKFTEQGTVSITARSHVNTDNLVQIVFEIQDTGIGIPYEKQVHLFDRFTQVDASDSRKYGGTGLGLSIVKTLCELMDGDVSVKSQPGEGSCFTVQLLLEKADAEPHHTEAVERSDEDSTWPKHTRILVAEDVYINQEVTRAMLTNLGLQADIAADGIEVLEQLKQSPDDAPYTLILMDCQMPEMDGFQASSAIRDGEAGERYLDIPIIALTANVMQGDKEKCLSAGMNDFLGKPVNPNELNETLIDWLVKKAS